MNNPVVLGLSKKIKDLDLDSKWTIIDLVNQHDFIDFESDEIQPLYQASLLAGQVNFEEFQHAYDFYDQVVTKQFELNYLKKKELLEYIKSTGAQVIKGRFVTKTDNMIELSYFGETQQIHYDHLEDYSMSQEENPYQSPFIFTFKEFIEANQLFKKVAIEATTLRSLEIASLLNRFSCDVTLITDRKFFSKINHLQFRDAIRETLVNQGVRLLEKYEVSSYKDLEQSIELKITPQSNLAFEIGEPLSEQTFEVDALIIENVEDSKENSVLFLNPSLAKFKSSDEGQIHQFDLDEFSYFRDRFEVDGGIEYKVFDNKIVGATFYCQDALDLKQNLMTLQHLRLNELSELDVLDSSLLGVLKESSKFIIGKDEQYGQTISSFN